MTVVQVKPMYRCEKCKTPLRFQCNVLKEEKHFLGLGKSMKPDEKAQQWECPNCFESYVVKLE